MSASTTSPCASFSGLLPGRSVSVAFDAGRVSSDGGLVLVAELARQENWFGQLAGLLHERRQKGKVSHDLEALFSQRVLQLVAGYEDCVDANTLRSDSVFKVCVGREPASGPDLASQPTLSRWENSVGAGELYRLGEGLVRLVLRPYEQEAVTRVILDIDATDDPTHGQQEFNFYHGYFRTECYLPLFVFGTLQAGSAEAGPREVATQLLLLALLRDASGGGNRGALSCVERLVRHVRERWPKAEILLRADGAFAAPELYEWCEQNRVGYVIRVHRNAVLERLGAPALRRARETFAEQRRIARDAATRGEETPLPPIQQVVCGRVRYRAESWDRDRSVTLKAVARSGEEQVWFLVHHGLPAALDTPAKVVRFYELRADSENRIKELKHDMSSGRTSCHRFKANQFRLLLHALAYALLQRARALLKEEGSWWGHATVETLRKDILKVGALVIQSHRRIRIRLSSGHPGQQVWLVLARILERLRPPPGLPTCACATR